MAIPGTARGSVTVRKTVSEEAPIEYAASSRFGSMRERMVESVMNATGKKVSVSEMKVPQKP